MKVKRGEIVLVDFPYSDRSSSKVRPALVVQADVWNDRLEDTILALITSSSRRRLGADTQCFIDLSTNEGKQTGLKFDSVVQCENLLTYKADLILRVLGKLSDAEIKQIDRCLDAALGITRDN
jgi:mRNA interferase MazF